MIHGRRATLAQQVTLIERAANDEVLQSPENLTYAKRMTCFKEAKQGSRFSNSLAWNGEKLQNRLAAASSRPTLFKLSSEGCDCLTVQNPTIP